MSINSVSSLSFLGGFYYTSEIDREYLRIKNYLSQYGINPTGNRYEDERVYQLLVTREMNVERIQEMIDSSQKIEAEETTETEEYPWTDFMRDLGLEPTGDRETDKTKTIEELEKRIKSATSDYDKNHYSYLLSQVESEFNKTTDTLTNSRLDFTSAATILGNLNRAMLLYVAT